MDIHDVHDIQFLDLSDVDDYERNRVLASLQRNLSSHEFPWFIGVNEARRKGKKSKHQQDPTENDANPVATIHPAPEIPQNSPNMQYPPMNNIQGHPMPNTGYVNIAPSPIFNNPHVQSPVFAGNFPHVHSPNHTPIQTLRTIPTPPFFFATTASNIPILYSNIPMIVTGNNTFQSMGQTYGPPPPFVNGVDAIKVNVSSPPMAFNNVNKFEERQIVNEQQGVPEQSWQTYDNNANIQEYVEPNHEAIQHEKEAQSVVEQQHEQQPIQIQQNEIVSTPNPPVTQQQQNNNLISDNVAITPENKPPENITQIPENNGNQNEEKQATKKPWGSGKSWASLFNSSPSNGAQVVIETNDNVNQAVNEKSNEEKECPIKNPKKGQFVDPDCYRMGEFLMSYTMDGRALSLQPKGLINQSNYCYINSILQALIACPPVYNLLNKLGQNISSNEKRKPTPVIDGMCKFIKEFKPLPANLRVKRSETAKTGKKEQEVIINTDIPFEPSWIYKMLNGIRTDLIEGRQEDAEEFLGLLLNNLNDEMLELIKLVKNDETNEKTVNNNEDFDADDKEWQVMGPKNKGSITRRTEFEKTPISDIFGGFLKSRIHRAGDHVTENIQPFFTLQLNIEKAKTVKEALEHLTTRNQLEGLTSLKTNEEVEAYQQVMLEELPVILILHLKCFDYKLDGCTKIMKALEFPIDLKIDTKLLASKPPAPKERQQYKLFAVVYHDGKEASKGHYVTDAFHVGYNAWLRYDDAAVRPVREDDVLRPQGARVPYLLFYRRADTVRAK